MLERCWRMPEAGCGTWCPFRTMNQLACDDYKAGVGKIRVIDDIHHFYHWVSVSSTYTRLIFVDISKSILSVIWWQLIFRKFYIISGDSYHAHPFYKENGKREDESLEASMSKLRASSRPTCQLVGCPRDLSAEQIAMFVYQKWNRRFRKPFNQQSITSIIFD